MRAVNARSAAPLALLIAVIGFSRARTAFPGQFQQPGVLVVTGDPPSQIVSAPVSKALEVAGVNPDTCDLRLLEGRLNEPGGLWAAMYPALQARWPELARSIKADETSVPILLRAVEKAAGPQVSESDRDLVFLAADLWLRSRDASGSPEAFLDALGSDWNRYGFGSAQSDQPGTFAYCGSVLPSIAARAGRGNEWADRALIVLLDQGWITDCSGGFEGAHFGNEIFVPVLKHGEEFLKRHPNSRVWPSIALRVALAHETVWSLAMEAPADDYPDYKPGAPEHRRRALELYRQLLVRTKDSVLLRALQRRISDLEHGRDTKCQVYYLTGEC